MDSGSEHDVADGESEPKAHCKTCTFECVRGQEALGCDLCPNWYHRECIGYNKSTYKAIIQFEEIKWFCEECNVKCKDTLSMIQLVMQRIDVVEGRSSATEKKHAALEKRVLKLEQLEQERAERATVQGSSGIVSNSQHPEQSSEQVNAGNVVGNLSQRISEELREIKEIEERKTNIVISNIPEENTENEEERMKVAALGVQNGDNTKTVVEKIFTKIGVRNCTEIKEVIRIPQRIEAQPGSQPRKVLVKLANPKMQKAVLEKSKDMKKVGNGWETSYISPDLTKKQREKAFHLRVEKRRRTDAGETNLVIRNGEIVVKTQRNSGEGPLSSRSGAPETT